MSADLLAFAEALPDGLLYALLALGSAVENLVPPVPADTFVLLGGFLTGRGRLEPVNVFLLTWAANVVSALGVYWIGHSHGRVFFEKGAGRRLLRPRQLERMRRFYHRWGTPAIFFARFLPGLRAVVPAFAGVSHHRFWPVALPVALASALWYGALVWLGATAGRNLEAALDVLSAANGILLAVAGALGLAVAVWWLRSRGDPE